MKRWDGTHWVECGTGSASGWGITGAAAAADAMSLVPLEDGQAALEWFEAVGSFGANTYVARFDGSTWGEMGAGSMVAPGIYPEEGGGGSLVFQPGHAPVNVFAGQKLAAVTELHWTDSEWQPDPGTISHPQGLSGTLGNVFSPAVVLTEAGLPTIFWLDSGAGATSVYGLGWDGQAWVELGSGSASGTGISGATGNVSALLARVGRNNQLFVSWGTRAGASGVASIWLRLWDGNAWSELGGSASTLPLNVDCGNAHSPDLTVTSAGAPVVVWEDDTALIYLRYWDGVSWRGYPAEGALANGHEPAVAVAATGMPVVAYERHSNICLVTIAAGYVVEYTPGSADATAGCLTGTWNAATTPQIEIDPQERLVLTYGDAFVGNGEIHALLHDAAGWRWLGSTAVPFGNVSATAGHSWGPSLALDHLGRPWVAYADESFGAWNGEVYLKRWNTADWVEVGAGSASQGGVSNSLMRSVSPSLAVAGTRACLAWVESDCPPYFVTCDVGTSQLVLRCTQW